MKKNREKLIVLALGGNALMEKGKESIGEQFAAARKSLVPVVELIEKGYDFLISHGNGPQVGVIMEAVDAGKKANPKLPDTPLGVAVAQTEGSIGYMVEQCLQNMMIQRSGKITRNVVTVPTQVVVSKDDPSVKNPSKYIGMFYTEEEAKKLQSEKGWIMKADANRGWRRVVPSPYPVDIVEKDAINALLDNDYVVIAGGGGGIPVFYENSGERKGWIEGMDAVIDKDFATMKLAIATGSNTLIIVTGVRKVCTDFGKPTQKEWSTMKVAEAEKFLAEGQFPGGSMGPKIQAAIEFVKADKRNKAIITDIEYLPGAIEGKDGTAIVL